ncbi:hypothetical protein ES5_14143 [Dietzia cinnamea P4]|nr:hypothetical protein ES5_14143 [Dietzia cinnamea P4]
MHAVGGEALPQLHQLVDGRARLLDVLQARPVQRHRPGARDIGGAHGLVEDPHGVCGLRHRPRPVGVDPHPRAGPGLQDGGDAGDVVDQLLPLLRHLDLDRHAPREAVEDRADLAGRHRRDRGVDRDPRPHGRRRALPRHLDRRGEPVGGLGIVVLAERPELAPPGGPVDQHELALGDAAEPHPHRQGHHVNAVEQIVDRLGARYGCHGSTLTSKP